MILGYNQPRPTEKEYHNFLDRLITGLETLGNNELSLMVWGSYPRGDYNPGRSDIDAILFFPYDVVVDKEFLKECSTVLKNSLKGNELMRELFQVTPLDTGIMKDGRFNSFTNDFREYFNLEGKIILGPDYRKKIVYLNKKTGEQASISHNIRKIRQSLLFSEFDIESNYEQFLRGLNSSLNAVSRGSKQILYLADGKLRVNRFSALEELSDFFPRINIKPLEKIKDLFNNPKRLDKVYLSSQEALNLWVSSVTFLEELIKEYIKNY